MSIVVRFTPAGLTAEQYSKALRMLEDQGAFPPGGLDYHVCFGWRRPPGQRDLGLGGAVRGVREAPYAGTRRSRDQGRGPPGALRGPQHLQALARRVRRRASACRPSGRTLAERNAEGGSARGLAPHDAAGRRKAATAAPRRGSRRSQTRPSDQVEVLRRGNGGGRRRLLHARPAAPANVVERVCPGGGGHFLNPPRSRHRGFGDPVRGDTPTPWPRHG